MSIFTKHIVKEAMMTDVSYQEDEGFELANDKSSLMLSKGDAGKVKASFVFGKTIIDTNMSAMEFKKQMKLFLDSL